MTSLATNTTITFANSNAQLPPRLLLLRLLLPPQVRSAMYQGEFCQVFLTSRRSQWYICTCVLLQWHYLSCNGLSVLQWIICNGFMLRIYQVKSKCSLMQWIHHQFVSCYVVLGYILSGNLKSRLFWMRLAPQLLEI